MAVQLVCNASVKKYPGFFQGLEGAWCPSVQFPRRGTEATGNQYLYDLSGNGHHGTFHNAPQWEFTGSKSPSTQEDKAAWSLFWPDTMDGGVDIPGLDTFAARQGTIMAWALEGDFANSRYVFSRNTSGNNDGDIMLFRSTTGDEWRFLIQRGGVTSSVFSDVTSANGKWTHIVGVWDVTGTNNTFMYVDGVLQADFGTSEEIVARVGVDWSIGWNAAHTDTDGEAWEGNIDDCALWNRRLSPNEIRQLYYLGRGGWHAEKVRVSVRALGEVLERNLDMEHQPHAVPWAAVPYHT